MYYDIERDYTDSRRGMLLPLPDLEGKRRQKVDSALHEGRPVEALSTAYTPRRIAEAFQVSLGRITELVRGGKPTRDEAVRINQWLARIRLDLKRKDESQQVADRLLAEIRRVGSEGGTVRVNLRTTQAGSGLFEVFADCVTHDGTTLWTSYAFPALFKTEAIALKYGRLGITRHGPPVLNSLFTPTGYAEAPRKPIRFGPTPGKPSERGNIDDVVRTRITKRAKQDATEVLEAMGLSISDAIRLFLEKVAQDRKLPFEIQTPGV